MKHTSYRQRKRRRIATQDRYDNELAGMVLAALACTAVLMYCILVGA